MKLWIRVDACMARDPKVAEFAAAIGSDIPTTVGHLAMVWGAMAEHAVDGWIGKTEETPTKGIGNGEETPRKPLPNALIESYAMWQPKRGRPRGTFARAFRELFVLSDGTVNGWAKRQGALIERMEKDRKRKIRGNSSETPGKRHGKSASTERNGTERETISAIAGAIAPDFKNWNSTFGSEWAAAQSGVAPFGRIGKALKKLIARDGAEKHWDAWCRFVRSEKAKYGPEYFATHRKDFEPPPVRLALTSAGIPVMSPAETAAFKLAELEAINAHRIARGDAPIVA